MSFLLQLLFLLGLPALVALTSAYLCWGALSRPGLYLLVSLIGLYALYVVAFYLVAPKSVGYMISAVQPGDPSAREPLLMLLEPYARPMLVFAVAALPALLVLLRLFRKVGSP